MNTNQLIPGLVILSAMVLAAAPVRPNILLNLRDDLAYADVGFNGADDIRTPGLDRLAKAGWVFTSAHVCHPFCGPSRMGMMAGRQGARGCW